MKDYNFILFHKAIDSVAEALSSADKAKMRLIGAVHKADKTPVEDETIHYIQYKLDTVKVDLETIKILMRELDRPK